MTLREMANVVEDKEDAIGFLQIAFQILRTVEQGEPATFEDCCASCLGWIEIHGMPSKESVQKWVDDIPAVMDLDIPSTFWFYAFPVEYKDNKCTRSGS